LLPLKSRSDPANLAPRDKISLLLLLFPAFMLKVAKKVPQKFQKEGRRIHAGRGNHQD
jgi:hypothetical protein